ncbi:retrovirus-related Pol polyprotein from transposon 17.6 [Trichonephila clavata]|uniref:Retrovirus-related Pol polyprotein from transposon 17.6 n=1 Tax=Trichonephila clavata TaxID=2740835 RepID=A0A8X6LCX7_TRICU|nr:retrovirus-related Pol polyprotein from transposon 17.6 [Trichonephila clavata]
MVLGQLSLEEESSYLTTFCTPWGWYRFLVLPLGLKSAPEEFQKAMDEIYEEDEDINPYFDDIALGSSTKEEHCILLRRTLLKARKANLKFNVMLTLWVIFCRMQELNQIPRKLEPLKSLQHQTAKKICKYFSVW